MASHGRRTGLQSSMTKKPTVGRYDLEALRSHTASIRHTTENLTRTVGAAISEAFHGFSDFIEQLEREPVSLERNVRLLIACRFLNHIYAALLLSEAGLVVDSVACERAAIEALGAFRLVVVAPEYSSKYETSKFPRPKEVRDILNLLGWKKESEYIKGIYSNGSELLHITRKNERFNVTHDSGNTWKLHFGGRLETQDHSDMLRFIPAIMQLFMQGIGMQMASGEEDH